MERTELRRWNFACRMSRAAVLVGLAGSSAFGQGVYPPAAGTAAAAAPQAAAATTVFEPGDVYLSASRVYAFVGKIGLGHEHGVMGQLQAGKLQLDATQDAGQLVFEMGSFVADTDGARKYVGLSGTTPPSTQQEVRANMLGSAVLDTARYPTASFVVRSATRLPQPSSHGLAQYQLQGDFTLHGVTRPIQMVAEAEERQGWVHLHGGFPLVQSQFGITPFTKAFGMVGVADQVNVYGDLWIAKERQTVAAAGAPANR